MLFKKRFDIGPAICPRAVVLARGQRPRANTTARKAGPLTLIGPSPTLILLIGPLIQIASLLLSRAGGMLQGI